MLHYMENSQVVVLGTCRVVCVLFGQYVVLG